MAQSVSDSTLSFLFDEGAKNEDGLCDPFDEPSSTGQSATTAPEASRRAGRRRTSPAQLSLPADGDGETDASLCTFRWDVEVPLADRAKCGPKFMKQWKRVLQAQKLTPLVSLKLPLHEARFQLCVSDNGEATLVAAHEQEIAEELARLRRDASSISGDPAGVHPTGWQGVRVWMTFARRDVDTALAKKPKI